MTEFASELTIANSLTGPAVFSGFTKLGTYKITSGETSYYATLSYKLETTAVPRILNVEIAWLSDYQPGVVSDTDQSVKLAAYTGS